MDEKRTGFSLKAPGRSGSDHPRRLPGRGWPRVDDHLVEPEVTRDEIIGGLRVVASPAQPPHATRHTQLDYVVRALVAPGFTMAPLPVAALLDAAAADKAVAEALIAKGDPTLREREAGVRADGILTVLEARGVAVSQEQSQEIRRCHDLDRLDQWLRAAALASSVEEVLSQA